MATSWTRRPRRPLTPRRSTPCSTPPPPPTNRGLLPTGTVLPDGGLVEAVSLTAYRVLAVDGGSWWRSFDEVHGRPAPVMPLVVLR